MATIAKQVIEIKTKYGSFSCIFKPELDMGGYVVVARDMQGAVSWGKNLSEAKRMIAEAIEGIVELKVLAHEEKEGRITIKNRTTPSNIA